MTEGWTWDMVHRQTGYQARVAISADLQFVSPNNFSSLSLSHKNRHQRASTIASDTDLGHRDTQEYRVPANRHMHLWSELDLVKLRWEH